MTRARNDVANPVHELDVQWLDWYVPECRGLNRREIEKLWSDFSRRIYGASWHDPDNKSRQRFRRWLKFARSGAV